jgi:choice-of-anchor B domain-containing protein
VSPHYTTSEIGSTHNIVAAPEAGKMIGVGLAPNDKTCPGKNVGHKKKEMLASLAIFDVFEDPVKPVFEACVYVDASRGYVHDAHCIKYHGPDVAYQGVNICALFMEEEVVIFNLDALKTINKFKYETSAYVHQGWFSEDHTILYADDELDEEELTTGTDFSTCYIFDMADLDGEIQPPLTFVTPSAHPSIDHNLYVKDGYIYQAAYTSGARIRKIKEDKTLEEVAFFDGEGTCECVAAEGCDCDFFAGTWTYFPYFDSGITIAGGTAEGLFILQPTL